MERFELRTIGVSVCIVAFLAIGSYLSSHPPLSIGPKNVDTEQGGSIANGSSMNSISLNQIIATNAIFFSGEKDGLPIDRQPENLSGQPCEKIVHSFEDAAEILAKNQSVSLEDKTVWITFVSWRQQLSGDSFSLISSSKSWYPINSGIEDWMPFVSSYFDESEGEPLKLLGSDGQAITDPNMKYDFIMTSPKKLASSQKREFTSIYWNRNGRPMSSGAYLFGDKLSLDYKKYVPFDLNSENSIGIICSGSLPQEVKSINASQQSYR